MEVFSLNLIAILTATFVGMVSGALWYSPILFGNQWIQAIGKTPETMGNTTIPLIGGIVSNFLTSIGIALIFSLAGVANLSTGISLGLIIGFLIIFPAFLSDSLFCNWGTRLLLIQSGYRMLSTFLMSIVLFYLG